jgi:c(7)-type cytochrome triheme protein
MKGRRLIIFFASITMILALSLSATGEEEKFYGGDILFTKPVKSVLFSHVVHTGELGFGCVTCHNGIFEMKKGASEEAGDFTMKALYEGKYCGACHNGEMAFSSDTQCARCHTGVKGERRFPEELQKASDYLKPEGPIQMGEGATGVSFSHQSHASIFGCSECHPETFSLERGGSGITMDGIYQGGFCGKCHNGETAFSTDGCASCHPGMAGR